MEAKTHQLYLRMLYKSALAPFPTFMINIFQRFTAVFANSAKNYISIKSASMCFMSLPYVPRNLSVKYINQDVKLL